MNLMVRDVPSKVMAALDSERRRRGTSLDQTVIDLLELALSGEGRNGF